MNRGFETFLTFFVVGSIKKRGVRIWISHRTFFLTISCDYHPISIMASANVIIVRSTTFLFQFVFCNTSISYIIIYLYHIRHTFRYCIDVICSVLRSYAFVDDIDIFFDICIRWYFLISTYVCRKPLTLTGSPPHSTNRNTDSNNLSNGFLDN